MTEDHLLGHLREFLRWPEDCKLMKQDFLLAVIDRIRDAVEDETYMGGKHGPHIVAIYQAELLDAGKSKGRMRAEELD